MFVIHKEMREKNIVNEVDEEYDLCIYKELAGMDSNKNFEDMLKNCYSCPYEYMRDRGCYVSVHEFMHYLFGGEK